MRYELVRHQVRHLQGWRPDRADHRDRVAVQSATDLPARADLLGICPPVRDQGSLGSCVANSSLEAMGFLYTRKGKPDPKLSRLFAYYYTRTLEGTPPTEDSGCQIRDCMKVLASLGCCLEATWPYEMAKFDAAPPPSATVEAGQHKLLLYVRLPSIRTIKASIVHGYPVVGGFTVPDNMMSDACTATGDVKYPGPGESFVGGHAVLFVGYDDEHELLTFQNSWGTQWGRSGRGTLPYKFITSGLAEDFWSLRLEAQP